VSEEHSVDASKIVRVFLSGLFVLVLAFGILLFMLGGSLMGLGAEAAACTMSPANGGEQSSLAWPTDKHEISRDWSDPDPNSGASHQGIDFDVAEGSKVYAANDGKVKSTANNTIVITHEMGIETHYEYIKDSKVGSGDTVKRGQQIASSGSGNEAAPGMTGAHLHFEIWLDQEGNGHPVNTHMKENPFTDGDSGSGSNSCSCIDGNLSGTNNQHKAFNFFVQNGFSKEQAAGIVGNMIAESGVEPMRLQNTRSGTETKPSEVLTTELGWGIVQWTPARKMVIPSRTGKASDEEIGSLGFQLQFLLKQLRGQGPLPEKPAGDALLRASSVEQAAYEFGDKFERFGGHENPNHPTYAERKANAQHVYKLFAGSAPGGNGADPAASTGGGCGAGSGNIAEVAKSLAWPDDGHNSVLAAAAKKEYVAAMEKYNDGPAGDDPYSDCGRFVATVMRMSGADPDFPKVYTPTQKSYMESPGKYDYWHGEPPGGMKPGDILNGPGHTYLYIGPWGADGRGFNAASGSLHDHVPQAGYLYDVGKGSGNFTVYRLKSAPKPAS
jgi:hypothetical protein